jgi:hypothetical protein
VGYETGWGGGIYNVPTMVHQGPFLVGRGGFLTVLNSTIAGNHASIGGGILNNYVLAHDGGAGTVTIQNSTLSGNTAIGIGDGGGAILNRGTATAGNSILAGNTPNDVVNRGSFTDMGHNLIGGNPLLGPLQDNGGPTPTMALLAGSPALNTGDPAQLGVADQRGVVRSGGVNIGAYQASASTFALTAPATVTAGTPFDLTVQAVDVFGQVALGYTGTVTFSATDTDPAVVLPADHAFTAADQGTHTFSAGFTLVTPGSQTVTAADMAGGFSASLTLPVTP